LHRNFTLPPKQYITGNTARIDHLTWLNVNSADWRRTMNIKELLLYQDICPKCKVNWSAIEDSLHSPLGSEDLDQAHWIIDNCPTCSKRFERRENERN